MISISFSKTLGLIHSFSHFLSNPRFGKIRHVVSNSRHYWIRGFHTKIATSISISAIRYYMEIANSRFLIFSLPKIGETHLITINCFPFILQHVLFHDYFSNQHFICKNKHKTLTFLQKVKHGGD
jgi:hypothetical protein